ncbi:hypothetical protein L207DRAFT_505154 [Hyaloscypha variabilis F]|uniref:Uncharacterized protein n=1 Tax=Hyaloscypha variabilis (strain UAMH 11265 / GT02V1 / F) TaxID=1149755 RepID=A0A2J6SBD6_HYAVF|nr:hypothetical protein L207DRAFT_505154 [Hyaloscypha variabilis F]
MAVVGSGTHLLLCAPFSMPLSALVRHDIYLIRTLVMIQTQIHSIFEEFLVHQILNFAVVVFTSGATPLQYQDINHTSSLILNPDPKSVC